MNQTSAVRAIEKNGMLLVFPINNKKDPPSLWSVHFPRTKMRWEWDEDGDNRVSDLWHLREKLSRSRKVIYTKWYQGRATFFSLECFSALLTLQEKNQTPLSREARQIYELLLEESPQSTKQLKRASGLVGRRLEGIYQRALKELWSRSLIVAYGEVDEGAFPSIAVGATKVLFEELYERAREADPDQARATLEARISSPAFLKQLKKQLSI